MASSIIHLCIAKEILKNIKTDETLFKLGSIAPDAHQIDSKDRVLNRNISHFCKENSEHDFSLLDKFLDKYFKYIDDPFVLGYYVHLFADNIWLSDVLLKITDFKNIKRKNNRVVKLNGKMYSLYIYNDYYKINNELVKQYNINLNFFNQEYKIDNVIEELNTAKISLLLNESKIALKDSIKRKSLTFDLDDVNSYIKNSSDTIIKDLKVKRLI